MFPLEMHCVYNTGNSETDLDEIHNNLKDTCSIGLVNHCVTERISTNLNF